jgi:glycosyltransferase involved in cell wall biosynthesis
MPSLISVIIPTHNRASYAIPTVRALLALSAEIQVVICDTSELDLISMEFIGEEVLGDRLVMVRPGRPLSVVDNFNEAMSAATGKYFVFIGDDDFVSAKIVDVAKWAFRESIDSIKFTFPVQYYWPDFIHRSRADEYSGSLYIESFTGEVSLHCPKKALAEALDNFGGGVFEMPRAYSGMISSELAKKIKAKHGALFGGVSPDIFSAALISIESKKCVKIDFPIIIPGASGASTAGQSANGKHVGGLRDNPHIGAFENLNWDVRIPEFYSVPTVWSYSLLKAIEVSGLDLNKINFPRLYSKCFIYHRKFAKFTLVSLGFYIRIDGRLNAFFGLFGGCIAESWWIARKLYDRFIKRYSAKDMESHRCLPDTFVASLKLEKLIEQMDVALVLNSDFQ